MIRRFLPPLIALTTLLFPPIHAPAQVTPPASHHYNWPVPNFELYGGYSYVFRSYDRSSQNVATSGMNGWDASLKIPVPIFGDWLGIKGDVSGFYRNDSLNFNPGSYFFLIGPQVSFHLGRSTVFAHGLVGSAHLNQSAVPDLKSDHSFAVAVGAGLDAGLSRHWAWRVTGDYYNTNYQSTNHNVREITNSDGRISTGPLFRF